MSEHRSSLDSEARGGSLGEGSQSRLRSLDRSPSPQVKGVVFLTFWQGTVIWALTCTEHANPFASKEMADAVQNFLICVEMFIASVVHTYTFSADERDLRRPPRMKSSEWHEMDPRDLDRESLTRLL